VRIGLLRPAGFFDIYDLMGDGMTHYFCEFSNAESKSSRDVSIRPRKFEYRIWRFCSGC